MNNSVYLSANRVQCFYSFFPMDGKRLKANIAFLFGLLATGMMLLGSVVPHHHHGAALCVDISHCREHGAAVPAGDCHHDGGEACPRTAHHDDIPAHCTLNINYYCCSLSPKQALYADRVGDDNDTSSVFSVFLPAVSPYMPALPCRGKTGTFSSEPPAHLSACHAGPSALRAPPVEGACGIDA